MTCPRCQFACYCGSDCQKRDWQRRHKLQCSMMRDMTVKWTKEVTQRLPVWLSRYRHMITTWYGDDHDDGNDDDKQQQPQHHHYSHYEYREKYIQRLEKLLSRRASILDDRHPLAGRLLLCLAELYGDIGCHAHANTSLLRARECHDYWVCQSHTQSQSQALMLLAIIYIIHMILMLLLCQQVRVCATLLYGVRLKQQGDSTESRTCIQSLLPDIRTIHDIPSLTSSLLLPYDTVRMTSIWCYTTYMMHFERAISICKYLAVTDKSPSTTRMDDKKTVVSHHSNGDDDDNQRSIMGHTRAHIYDRWHISDIARTCDGSVTAICDQLVQLSAKHHASSLASPSSSSSTIYMHINGLLTRAEWFIGVVSNTSGYAIDIASLTNEYSHHFYDMLISSCYMIDTLSHMSMHHRVQYMIRIILCVRLYHRTILHDNITCVHMIYTILTRYGTLLSSLMDYRCSLEWRIRLTSLYDYVLNDVPSSSSIYINNRSLLLTVATRCIRGGIDKNVPLLMSTLFALIRHHINDNQVNAARGFYNRALLVLASERYGMPWRTHYEVQMNTIEMEITKASIAATSVTAPSSLHAHHHDDINVTIDGDQCSICGAAGIQTDYDGRAIGAGHTINSTLASSSVSSTSSSDAVAAMVIDRLLMPCADCRWNYSCITDCHARHQNERCSACVRSSSLPQTVSDSKTSSSLPSLASLIPPLLRQRHIKNDID